MRPSSSLYETASEISRALISASKLHHPVGLWTCSLEQKLLHPLGDGDALSPSLVAEIIDPHLLHYPSLSTGFFNWASDQPNFSHSATTYHSLLKSLSLSRQFTPLSNLLEQAKSRSIPIDPSIYDSLIASRIRLGKTLEAFRLFIESTCSLGSGCCNSLLASLASVGDLDSASKVFDEMVVRGIGFTTLGFGVYVWRWCGKCTDLNEFVWLLDRVREEDCFSGVNGSVVAVLVAHGLCAAGRALEAVDALEELRNRNCKPDFMAYRVVAESLRSTGYAADVEMVLKRKRKLGVAPRISDYREFIFELISEGRIKEAKELGEVIVDGSFPMDDDVLDFLMASVSAIDPASALLFLTYMVERGRGPALCYLSDMGVNLCRNGKEDKLMVIFESLSSIGYFMDLKSHNVMLSLLCRGGKVREAYSVLQQMRKKGIGYDVSSYNMLMEALCREDYLRPAKKLWDEMFANGITGNLETYNMLIKKFLEIGQTEEAQVLFSQMMEKGVAPDETTYVSIVEGLCGDRKIDNAVEIVHKAVDKQQKVVQVVLGQVVVSLCKGGNIVAASKLLCGICSSFQRAESHVVLLKCLVDAGEVMIAKRHLRMVRDASSKLTQEISTILLGIFSSPESVLDLLGEADNEIFVPVGDAQKVWSLA